MAEPYPIRPVTLDEITAFRAVSEQAFHTGPAPEHNFPQIRRMFEAERSLAAFDPALPASAGPVGVAGAFTFRMAVPGGLVPTAGVSYVAVLPTYRRRGILRSLMHRQLADISAKGEPIAALWASETPLYGRYGYGMAAYDALFTFRRGEGALSATAPADPALRLRLAEPLAAAAELAKVYDAVLQNQPGFFARNDVWWERVLRDHPEDRRGFSPLRCLLAEDDSGTRGYALYAAQQRWEQGTGLPDGLIEIRELIAADPAAGAALWHDLLSRDLVAEVTARLRPANDPVLFQLFDPRRARTQVADGIWVRIVDLPAALTARAYSCPVDVVLEVRDELLTGNTGRWHLRATGPQRAAEPGQTGRRPSGAVSCERTSEPLDIALDIRELGAAYLGGTRLGTLAAAGLVTELRQGTLAPLSAAMSWDPSPWCPVIF